MMTNVSLTAIEMLAYSILSAVFIFDGYRFRYARQVSLTLVLYFLGQLIIRVYMTQTEDALSFIQVAAVAAVSLGATYALNRWTKPFLPVIFQIAATSFLSLAVTLFFRESAMMTFLIAMSVLNIAIFLLLRFFKAHFLILCSVLTGSAVLSTLFSIFYYFTLPVHIILFILLSAAGLLVQENAERKRRGRSEDA